MPVRASQPPPLGPGQASLAVTGQAGLDAASLRFAVEQPASGRFLQRYGVGEPWGTTRTWLKPESVASEGGQLAIVLGPRQTWHLKANVTYLLHLRDANAEAPAPERLLWKGIRLPSAPPERPAEPEEEEEPPPAPPPPKVEEPPPEPPAPEPPPPPPPTPPAPPIPTPPPHGWNRRAIAALLLLLLAAGGAGYWWYGSRAPEAVATAAPLTIDSARTYLKGNPTGDAALGEAERYARAATPDAVQGALLIYTHAAQAGSGPAATAIGRMYDPDTFDAAQSAVPAADPEKAFLWYDRAADLSDPEGLYRRGVLVMSGRVEQLGVPPESGVHSLERSAELGYAEAKAALEKLNGQQAPAAPAEGAK